MKRTVTTTPPGLQVKPEKKPIHIGIPLVILVSLVYVWWFWDLHSAATKILDHADHQQKLAQVNYTQAIGLVKNQPAIILAKSDPFRAHTRWVYTSTSNPLPESYAPILSKLSVSYSKSIKNPRLAPEASSALGKLFKKATKDGFPLMVASAYRSTEEQKQLKVAYAKQHGQGMADAYIANPGTSEHETGLAVDVDNKDSACESDADRCSLSPATATWLAKNAPKFGFIIRYPEDKEKQTGIHYEPWHLRYIGKDAPVLTASKLTLDEFVKKVESK
ncbi:MAG TPA: M15 family metallopeptidase [Candidatus Saccharimonadales bacterium]